MQLSERFEVIAVLNCHRNQWQVDGSFNPSRNHLLNTKRTLKPHDFRLNMYIDTMFTRHLVC